MGDYIIRDSSVIQNPYAFGAHAIKDTSVRIGIIREVRDGVDGPVYMVEVLVDGKMLIVGCTLMTRFGGAHNFEEYQARPWAPITTKIPSPTIAAEYKSRAGDTVVVAYLNGRSKEGVILGGIRHPSRKTKLKKGSIGYLSEFNGLETSIKEDGSYRVTFKGYSISNKATLALPPTGTQVVPPVYNPLFGGSYFGFDSKGSYIVSDGAKVPGPQFLKINKNPLNGSIIIKSGTAVIQLGGSPLLPSLGISAVKGVMEFTDGKAKLLGTLSMKSDLSMALESKFLSVKANSIAIGSQSFELMQGLVKLITALGTVVVTSPVGSCLPLAASPTWAQVLQFQAGVISLLPSLKSAESFALKGDDGTTIDTLG